MNRRAAAAAALLALGAFAPADRAADPKATPVRLLVPAYFYPAGEGLAAWKRLVASADRAPIVAVVNPDSGPGRRADENYRAVFRLIRGSRLTPIGYVTLGYGKRPAARVKAEVDRWLALYPDVRGVFFDEQPSGADLVPFARECFAHARARFPGGVVVSNPGTACDPGYLRDPDGPTVCLYENRDGFDAYRPPDWVERVGAGRVAVLLYGVPDADRMRRRFAEALRKQARTVYVTDAAGANPWDRLPSYWDRELAEAARAAP